MGHPGRREANGLRKAFRRTGAPLPRRFRHHLRHQECASRSKALINFHEQSCTIGKAKSYIPKQRQIVALLVTEILPGSSRILVGMDRQGDRRRHGNRSLDRPGVRIHPMHGNRHFPTLFAEELVEPLGFMTVPTADIQRPNSSSAVPVFQQRCVNSAIFENAAGDHRKSEADIGTTIL